MSLASFEPAETAWVNVPVVALEAGAWYLLLRAGWAGVGWLYWAQIHLHRLADIEEGRESKGPTEKEAREMAEIRQKEHFWFLPRALVVLAIARAIVAIDSIFA